MLKLLVLLSLGLTAAFTVPHAALRTRSPVMAAAKDEEPAAEEPTATFPDATLEDTPSEDPMVTCFLAPDWVGTVESANKWVCQPLAAIAKIDSTSAEDGY